MALDLSLGGIMIWTRLLPVQMAQMAMNRKTIQISMGNFSILVLSESLPLPRSPFGALVQALDSWATIKTWSVLSTEQRTDVDLVP